MKSNLQTLAILLLGGWILAGCAPSVGSDAWCEMMKEKPKGDWSVNAAADFAKHCVLK